GDGLEEAKVVHLVFGNLAGVKDFRAAEKISLEIREAGVLAGAEFFAGFNFLGQHAASGVAEAFHYGGLLGGCGAFQIDLDDVGEVREGGAGIVGDEVVEGNHVSSHLQTDAGGAD